MRSVTSLLAAALVAGFPDEPTRKAFEDHRFSNSYTLPAGTGHGWVAYSDGSRDDVEVLSAGAAYSEMRDSGPYLPCPVYGPDCAELLTVPAWAFSFRGVADPVIRVALNWRDIGGWTPTVTAAPMPDNRQRRCSWSWTRSSSSAGGSRRPNRARSATT